MKKRQTTERDNGNIVETGEGNSNAGISMRRYDCRISRKQHHSQQ